MLMKPMLPVFNGRMRHGPTLALDLTIHLLSHLSTIVLYKSIPQLYKSCD